jgi:hypothetical protein
LETSKTLDLEAPNPEPYTQKVSETLNVKKKCLETLNAEP